MDKKKEIEKMAEVLETAKIKALGTIGSLNQGFGMWYANALYDAGYRKIPEGAVVLTKEELNDRLYQSYSSGVNFAGKQMEDQKAKVRRETAKEILDEVSKRYGVWLGELYKKYGVEVDG